MHQRIDACIFYALALYVFSAFEIAALHFNLAMPTTEKGGLLKCVADPEKCGFENKNLLAPSIEYRDLRRKVGLSLS
jgi:hypothetical protein